MSNVQRVQIKRAMAPARGITTPKIERLKADGWEIVDTRRVNGMVEHVLVRPDYAAKMRDARKQRLREGRQYKREARRAKRQQKIEQRGTLLDRTKRSFAESREREQEKRLAKAQDPLRGRFVPRNDPRHPEHPDYRPPVWEHVDMRPADRPAVQPTAPRRPGRWGPFSTIAGWLDRADDAWVARSERRSQGRGFAQAPAEQRKPKQSR